MKYKGWIVVGIVLLIWGGVVFFANIEKVFPANIVSTDTIYCSDVQKLKCDSLYRNYIESITAYNAAISYQEEPVFIQAMQKRYQNDSIELASAAHKYLDYLETKEIFCIIYTDDHGQRYTNETK